MPINIKPALLPSFTLSILLLTGCTWVEPTELASSVSLIETTTAQGCERLGSTTSSVKDQIGWFNRGEDKVTSELVTLAKNAAASMGGNSIATSGELIEGAQQFIVYACP